MQTQNFESFVKLAGSTGSAETLAKALNESTDGIFKPKTTQGLQHLIRLGYLKPDFGRGVILVLKEKIISDLQSVEMAGA